MSAPRPRHKLPPLVRYQVDLFHPEPSVGDVVEMHPAHYFSIKAAREDWCSEDYGPGHAIIIRRLSDGRICWRNKAAEEAGL